MLVPNSATKTTRFFTTLSLNAPWNCVTMSAQKPRDEEGGGFGISDCGPFMAQRYSILRSGGN